VVFVVLVLSVAVDGLQHQMLRLVGSIVLPPTKLVLPFKMDFH
jgi:hypothetical protein